MQIVIVAFNDYKGLNLFTLLLLPWQAGISCF